jgi:hypothetical protein
MGVFVLTTYTALMVVSNKWFKVGSNLEPPDYNFSKLSDYELSQRVYGSKMMIVTEQTQISVVWACKACLLIMYYRLTRTALRNENLAIKMLSVYVALGYIVMQILYFAAWCRPFQEYYAVPTDSTQCNTLLHHRITKAVFNISSDVIMLSIALQMLIRSKLPWKRKLVLIGIFSIGIFAIVAAVLNGYYSLTQTYSRTWMFWYIRESSVAVIVANIPFTWTILRELFEVGEFDNVQPWSFHPRARTTSMATHTTRQTGSSGQRARTHDSLLNSRGSGGTQSMTLVGSASPGNQNGTSLAKGLALEHIDRGVEIQAVRSHDFASAPSNSNYVQVEIDVADKGR